MNRIVACRPDAEQAINHRLRRKSQAGEGRLNPQKNWLCLLVSAKRPYYPVNPVNPVKIELNQFGGFKNLSDLDFFFFL